MLLMLCDEKKCGSLCAASIIAASIAAMTSGEPNWIRSVDVAHTKLLSSIDLNPSMCLKIPSPNASTDSDVISYPRLRFKDPNAHRQLLTPWGMKSSAPSRSVIARSTQFNASIGKYSSPCWCMVAMAQTALDMFWHAYSFGWMFVSCFAMSGRILGAVGCSASSLSVTPQFARPHRVDDTSRGPNRPRPSSNLGGSSLSRCSTSSASMAARSAWNRGSWFTGTGTGIGAARCRVPGPRFPARRGSGPPAMEDFLFA